jgi:hypothetical protein
LSKRISILAGPNRQRMPGDEAKLVTLHRRDRIWW